MDYRKYWPSDTRVNWLTEWLTNTSIGLVLQGLTDWLIDLLTQSLVYGYKGSLTDWFYWLLQVLTYWYKG